MKTGIFFLIIIIKSFNPISYAVADTSFHVHQDIINLIRNDKISQKHRSIKTPNDYTLPDNFKPVGILKKNIDGYQQKLVSEYAQDLMESITNLGTFYVNTAEVFRRKKLPEWYYILPIAISGGKVNSNIRIHSTGLWQLHYVEAAKFNVVCDSLVDFRKDDVASTAAFADFFSFLKENNSSTTEALAAFFCGQANVNAAKQRSNSNNINDYFVHLPIKERNHLSFALAIINLDAYNKLVTPELFVLEKEDLKKYRFDFNIPIPLLLEVTRLDKKIFAMNNPIFIGNTIPQNVVFKLPHNSLMLSADSLKWWIESRKNPIVEKETKPASSATPGVAASTNEILHKVKSGETLTQIAERYKTKVADIKLWNNLKNDHIFAGQNLKIYSDKTANTAETNPKSTSAYTTNSPSDFEIYEVKSGDTLWGISQKYNGVSDKDIREWNNLKNNDIFPGQKLKIYKK